ncbi:alpha/beta fold hydrolase [Vibrio cholerae]|nr:alpha/beta fold hydrolase [Vibrio cholerae]
MNSMLIDGQKMAYLDVGEGEVLLFGHSYLWDHQMWAPQVAALSQRYRCIVPDFWAHGGSEAAPAAMSNLKDYAQHMLALMDHLQIEHFSVIGLSVGGMWGAELALLAPKRVQSLVMMDTFVGLEPEVTHKKYFAMLDTIDQLQAVPAPIVEAVVPMFFASNTLKNELPVVAQFRSALQGLSGERAVEVARLGRMIFGRRDLMDEIENLTLPVLIMVGSEDTPRPALESYLMQDTIRGSQLEVIEGAGHISSLEQAESVTHHLQTFLATVY